MLDVGRVGQNDGRRPKLTSSYGPIKLTATFRTILSEKDLKTS